MLGSCTNKERDLTLKVSVTKTDELLVDTVASLTWGKAFIRLHPLSTADESFSDENWPRLILRTERAKQQNVFKA